MSCEGTEGGASQESIGVTDLCVDIQESTQIDVETFRACTRQSVVLDRLCWTVVLPERPRRDGRTRIALRG